MFVLPGVMRPGQSTLASLNEKPYFPKPRAVCAYGAAASATASMRNPAQRVERGKESPWIAVAIRQDHVSGVESGQCGVETLPVAVDIGLCPRMWHEHVLLAGIGVDIGQPIDDTRGNAERAAERGEQHGVLGAVALRPPGHFQGRRIADAEIFRADEAAHEAFELLHLLARRFRICRALARQRLRFPAHRFAASRSAANRRRPARVRPTHAADRSVRCAA
jgi:hypothetical protein